MQDHSHRAASPIAGGGIFDAGQGADGARAAGAIAVADRVRYRTAWKISRWASEEDRRTNRTYTEEEALRLFGAPQHTEIDGNVLLNEGINELWTIVCSSSGTKYDNSNAQLGTGTSSAGEDAAHTDLQAGGVWKGMMTSYPTYGTSQQAVWKSEYTSGEANQAWNEFSVRNGSSANKNLNRKVSAQGTKVAGQLWELTLTITLS
jgi:hypothetical protein